MRTVPALYDSDALLLTEILGFVSMMTGGFGFGYQASGLPGQESSFMISFLLVPQAVLQRRYFKAIFYLSQEILFDDLNQAAACERPSEASRPCSVTLACALDSFRLRPHSVEVHKIH